MKKRFYIEVLEFDDGDDRPDVSDPDNYPKVIDCDTGDVIAKGLVETLYFVDYRRFEDIHNVPGYQGLREYKEIIGS